MTNNITINPYATSVALGMFNVSSVGLRQGTAFPDPAIRNAQRTGILSDTETLPMWGGVGIYQNIPGVAGGPNPALGPVVGRANSLTGSKALAGFSVFDGANGMVTSPQSRVPLIGGMGQVMLYALGSRARIIVAADPVLIGLQGSPIGGNVSWDFVAQRLVPYIGTLTISSGTYNDTTGVVTLTMSTAIAFEDGDGIVVSSLTGTGAYASLNGTFTAIEPTDPGAVTVTYNAGAGLGASTITGGSLTLGSGASSALPVKVLDVQETNCEVVEYDTDTGFANWNFDGAAAVIQI
jgi:hypothetical protein